MSIITKLKEQISELNHKICKIQDDCSHPKDAVLKERRRGGEFDNEYYIIKTCSLCEKIWIEHL